MPTLTPSCIAPPLRWDIFCRVIDNFGDVGVCWRLCADLAQRGHQVRLFIDDASALAWMAPQGHHKVEILPWPSADQPLPQESSDAHLGDVIIEAFGCELPDAVQAAIAAQPCRVWINLEYLSAEPFVERAHGLPSPVMSGPAKGCTKWFFYPGFTPQTGGLIREPELLLQHKTFEPLVWRKSVLPSANPNALWVSVFCYDTAELTALLASCNLQTSPEIHWLITPGKSLQAWTQAQTTLERQGQWPPQWHTHELPWMSQIEFDHLLWGCDFNIVRGEDSLVRALWAARPFLWHIYPQDDDAHHVKLQAFLDRMALGDMSERLHDTLNHRPRSSELFSISIDQVIDRLAHQHLNARERLLEQYDLSTQLISFTYNKLKKA